MSPYTYDYPRPAVTVDVVIFSLRSEKLQALFVQRRSDPFAGKWALPGGFVEIEESLEQAAARELEEETGVKEASLEQLYTYGEPGRDPRGRTISVAYYALIPLDAAVRTEGGDDAARARWFPVDELPELAFDHAEIAADALLRLRTRLQSGVAGFQLLTGEFTLSELQHFYELVLGKSMDKRVFRRRILRSGLIEPTGNTRAGKGRRARLYRYRPDAI